MALRTTPTQDQTVYNSYSTTLTLTCGAGGIAAGELVTIKITRTGTIAAGWGVSSWTLDDSSVNTTGNEEYSYSGFSTGCSSGATVVATHSGGNVAWQMTGQAWGTGYDTTTPLLTSAKGNSSNDTSVTPSVTPTAGLNVLVLLRVFDNTQTPTITSTGFTTLAGDGNPAGAAPPRIIERYQVISSTTGSAVTAHYGGGYNRHSWDMLVYQAAAAGGGAMTGSAAGTSTATGTLTGKGALTGSVSGTSTATSSFTGPGSPVQTVHTYPGATRAITLTAGNFVVAFVLDGDSGSGSIDPTISDSGSKAPNGWHACHAVAYGALSGSSKVSVIKAFYTWGVLGGATTISFSGTNLDPGVTVIEISSADIDCTADPLLTAGVTAGGGAGTDTTVTLSPSAACVVVAGLMSEFLSSGPVTAMTGVTQVNNDAGHYDATGAGFGIGSGSHSVTFTTTQSNLTVALAAAFRAPGSGGAMTGSSAGTSTATGTLTGKGALTGSVSGTSTATGSLTASGVATGRYYLPITIDHTMYSADVSGAVVRLILTHADLKSVAHGGKVAAAGAVDVVPCANVDGTGAYPYYLNAWDDTAGFISLLFLRPSLSSSVDPVIYLRFGDASATDGSSPANVFDDATWGAWDMSNGVTRTGADMTGNGHTATFVEQISGLTIDPVMTPIGGGVDLYDNPTDPVNFFTQKMTVAVTGTDTIQFGAISGSTVWVSRNGVGADTRGRCWFELVGWSSDNGFYSGEVKLRNGTDLTSQFLAGIENDPAHLGSPAAQAVSEYPYAHTIPAGTLIYTAGRYDPVAMTITLYVAHIDGSSVYRYTKYVTSLSHLRGTDSIADNLTFGNSITGRSNTDGQLAHFRVHTDARTDAWFEAEASNLVRPGAFFTPGSTVDTSLTGTVAGACSCAGTLTGKGALVGSVAGIAAASGVLSSTGAITGSVAGTAACSGTLHAAGSLSGSAGGTATASATLTGGAALTGTTAGTATATAVLTGKGALTGVTAGNASCSGVLANFSAGAMTATTSGQATCTGTLSGSGAITGTTGGAASASATLTGLAPLIGSVGGQATASGILSGSGALTGAVAGQAAATGTLIGFAPLTGTTAGQASCSGTLTNAVAGQMTGACGGRASCAGVLAGSGALIGATNGVATVTAILTGAGALVGTTAGRSTLLGILTNAGAAIYGPSTLSRVVLTAPGCRPTLTAPTLRAATFTPGG